MRCPFCGSDYPIGAKHCPNCGASLGNTNQSNDPFGYGNSNNSYNNDYSNGYNNNFNNNNRSYNGAANEINNSGQIVFSIINLIFCNQILGIIALVFAVTARNAISYEEGERKLRIAKILNIVGVVLGLILTIIIIVLAVSGAFDFLNLYDIYIK